MKKRLFYVAIVAAMCICLGLATMVNFAHAQTVSAQAAVVMERTSHRILFGKNADMHLPMASTTKIVTALTVLNHANIDQVVCIPSQAVGVEGSSVYLREGEHLTVKELLLGLMLRSGNDCAVALALHVGGSVEAFAEMMNQTARKAGCTDTNFVNPHGLPAENHYTSAADLALLTCVALDNPVFREIVSTKTAKISNEGVQYDRILVNKNKLLNTYLGADGVKTGYTKAAGRCFVGSATRQGMQVVVVVLNCGPMFEETAQLLDDAFARYRLQTAVPQNKVCAVVHGKGGDVYCYCPQRFAYPVAEGERLHCETDLQQMCIRVFLNDRQIWSCPLRQQ